MALRRFFGCLLCPALLSLAAAGADELPDIHRSKPAAQPDDPQAEGRFRVDHSRLDAEEWREAIRKAQAHQSGRGRYTLMRLVVDDAERGEKIQAQATKLKEFTEKYHGGGGEYLVIGSGDFLLFEHVNSDRRKNNRDPVTAGSFAHGASRLWVEVPPNGVLGVVGDVILRKCPDEEMGVLKLKLDGPADLKSTPLLIGPVVVGGPYGRKHRVEAAEELELRLPPGDYKIMLPEFDVVKSRWDVTIAPKETTKVVFEVSDADDEAEPDQP